MSNLYFVYFEPQIDDEIIEHIENIKFIKINFSNKNFLLLEVQNTAISLHTEISNLKYKNSHIIDMFNILIVAELSVHNAQFATNIKLLNEILDGCNLSRLHPC